MSNAVHSSSQLRILYCEGDSEVLASHAALLQNAGHTVETAAGRKAVEEAIRAKSYDLVVLGPTVSKNDRHHLPYMAKKANETTRVLVMHTDGERHPSVDANLDTGRTVQDLVAKLADLWPKQQMAKGAAAGR
jgi:DNA-binding NtrC family response regulator